MMSSIMLCSYINRSNYWGFIQLDMHWMNRTFNNTGNAWFVHIFYLLIVKNISKWINPFKYWNLVVIPAAYIVVDLLLENMVSVIYIYFLWIRSVDFIFVQLAFANHLQQSINFTQSPFNPNVIVDSVINLVFNYNCDCFHRLTSSMICSLHTAVASSSAIINMSSVIAQLVLTMICYEIRAIDTLALLFSIDNIWSINLDRCLDQINNLYHDMNYSTFSLLYMTNILLYEGSTIIDCSLIIGNQMDTLFSGLMVVFTLYYQVARHLYLIFISVFV